jgi:hypothetical protein
VLLEALPIVLDGETGNRVVADIVQLARNHQLSAYDAAYLELAIRRGLPLACLDCKLKMAAATAGVVLFSCRVRRVFDDAPPRENRSTRCVFATHPTRLKAGAATCLEKSEKRGVQAARNGPSEDKKWWQRIELGIQGLNR